MSLIMHAENIEKEAKELLEISNILPVLECYGEIRFTGGYATHLMHKPDIDIHIISDDTSKKTAVKLLTDIIDLSFFRGHRFYDFVTHPKEGYSASYYIGVKVPFGKVKWNIDIWLLKEEDDTSLQCISLCTKATLSQKESILKLKDYKEKNNMKVSGHWIYKAVIENHVTSPDGLLDYLKHEKVIEDKSV